MKIKTYYAELPNMGDRLNELLITKVFGRDYVRHTPASSELSCIGSGMDCFMRSNRVYPAWYSMALRVRAKMAAWSNNVWCTGFIFSETKDTDFIRPMKFSAVRGELTKRRVEKIIGMKLDVPTGDGGIIVPLLFDKKIDKKYGVGVIPHFHEQDHPVFSKLKDQNANSIVVNLRDDPMKVIEQIASCEVVISSSLHGLIVADAFGVPSQWIVVTDALKGDGFKFADYYSAFGLDADPISVPTIDSWIPTKNDVIDRYRVPFSLMQDKQKQIYDAFPFK